MNTPRGDIRAKQAENPLKLDVSRDFVSASYCFFESGDFVKPLLLSFLRLWSHAFFDSLKSLPGKEGFSHYSFINARQGAQQVFSMFSGSAVRYALLLSIFSRFTSGPSIRMSLA